MATIKEEIMSIAEAQGYEGEGGSTIAEAVNALGSVMGGGGSGGSGGGGGNLVKVTISPNSTTQLIADKTNKEIYDLYSEGALIYFDISFGYNESTGQTTNMIATSYDITMGSEDNYNINVYYLSGVDKGMGEWKLQAGKLMSHTYDGSNKQFDPYVFVLS